MKTIERVKKLLAREEATLEREEREITYDRTRETAQVRKDCLDQEIACFEPPSMET